MTHSPPRSSTASRRLWAQAGPYQLKRQQVLSFVKDLLFLDAAIATLAPDIELFAEATQVATHFATRHGERIMADIGIDPRATHIDLDGLKASMGVSADTPSLTYRDLQERRKLIQRRMAVHRRGHLPSVETA